MFNGNNTRRRTSTTLPAIETLHRNVRKTPTLYSRRPRDIPFHLPHKKLLEKIEFVKAEPEPLTGFSAAQEERYQKERKVANLQLEPIKLDEGKDKKKKFKIRESGSLDFDNIQTTDPLKVKPVVASQKEVIDQVKNNPGFGFLYMIYAVHPENVYFTPYYLKVVPYENIDKRNYLTISPCGVTHYTNEMVFTKMHAWEQEYTIFVQLTDIKFFKLYRYWKAFYVWRKSILFRKFSKIRNKIAKNLFILTPVLGKALLSIQAMCCEMYMKSFADVSRDMDTAFFYFIEVLMKRVEYIREKLIEFRSVVLEIITQACHTALYIQGFVFDDRNVPPFQIIRGKPTGGMSYTEKANKRKYCERLAGFVKVTDYMTNYMLYRLTKRSNSMMAAMLRKHVEFTPDKSLLSGNEVDEILEVLPRNTDTCKWALFQVDAYVLPDGVVELNLSQKIITSYIEKMTNYWDEYVRAFHNFLNEETLQIFVQPTIMGKQVDWSAGIAPSLYFLMNQDKTMLEDISFIPYSINFAYESVWLFLQRMQGFMDNFKEAHDMDVELIKSERDVAEFRKLCDKLNKQMEAIEDVVSYQPLDLIFLCLCPFQELFRPQPRRLFEVVLNTTPDIGYAGIEEILGGINNITDDITKEPETAGELVAFNFMLDRLEPRVVFLEERLEYLRELYDLMGEFNIPIPPDDMTDYLGLSVALGTLRTNVDARLETRGKLAGLFASQIGKDIMELMMDVNLLRDEVVAPWLYDEKSDMEKVMETLEDLMEKLQACFARDKQIREWQKIFKIPPARLEQLDETINDVKLSQLLWKSSKEWTDMYHSWYEVPFNTLDMDDIQTTTINYGKIFNQLDKGVPPNKIVPKCKQTIDIIKEKIPVMSYLRNPSLKPRHWVKIEEILHTRITPDMVVTLNLLEELHAFQHAEELMEVAGQASSEAGLEALLKKVEEMWAALEFPVLLHKDARDVYVLGGLEEIQAALDESSIHIGTILSSRNCGPIKSRVEEWYKNLELFSKTLILGDTYTRLWENEVPGAQNQFVHKYIMNPKSLTIGELYGEVNLQTLEWHDGILPLSLRTAVQCEKPDHQWLICDGPVDAVWIENMNTVLDDNKMLCLSNSERIKLTPYVHMVFEVADLAQASPATVSRCGMVYIDPHELGYLPYVRSWLEQSVDKNLFSQENSEFLYELFKMLEIGVNFVNSRCSVGIKQVDISKVSALCFLMGALLAEPGERFPDKSAIKVYMAHCFIFSYVWCIGGNILEANRKGFEEVIKRQFEEYEEAEYFPQGFNFFDMYMDTKQRRLKVWAEIIPEFLYDSNRPFFETLVPTIDTVRYGYLFEKLLASGKPVMFTGNTGVGKTCVAAEVLNKMASAGYFIPVVLNFSAQTSSTRTQMFSLVYIVLSIIALVYRFACDAATADSVPASNFFINTLYRFYILDQECDAALALDGITSDYSVFVLMCITLSASVLTLVAAIVLVSVITTASKTNYYMNLFLYVYIGLCLGSLIVDLTLASHFGMDYTYITTNLNENPPSDPGIRYTLDSLRLGAMFFMSVTLKGYIGHFINVVLLVLLVIYLVEYVRDINKSEHSIHKMGVIKAYEPPRRHETCNHQCDICQHNRNGGAGSVGGSQLNYGYMNGEETPRSRSPMRDNLKPEYTNVGLDRSNSWQPTPGSSRPFSYLEDVKRPPPLRPVSPASDRGVWRREPREPWAPPVPVPDYSPHAPRRLKSAMKSYM